MVRPGGDAVRPPVLAKLQCDTAWHERCDGNAMQANAHIALPRSWLRGVAAALIASASMALAQQEGVGPHVAALDGYTLRANAVSSTSLPVEMTGKYDIDRDLNVGVLNVVVQRGDDANAPTVPAAITATVEDAARRARPVQIRATVANQRVSYIGTFVVTSPGEMHAFDLRVRPGDSDREYRVQFRDTIGLPRSTR